MKTSSSSTVKLPIGLLGLFWLVLITILYFISHKPFTPNQAISIAQSGLSLLIPVAIVMISGGLGYWLIERLNPLFALREESANLEDLVVQTAFGLGVLGLGVFLMGLTVGYQRWLVWVFFILLLLCLRKEISRWARGWKEVVLIWQSCGRLGILLFSLSIFILLSSLLIALAPPLGFDALVYHLALPNAYLQAGRFVYTPWNMFWGMPQISEMLFTLAMSLVGDKAAAVLGWLIAVMALVGVTGYTTRRIGSRPAAVALASLLSGLTFAQSPAWAYVDYWSFFFAVAFLIVLNKGLHKPGLSIFFGAGIFAGFAFSSKYTAGILVICGLLALFWNAGRKYSYLVLFRQAGVFILGGMITALPWLLKNILATGNPFYPLLFPAGAMTPSRLEFYQGGQAWGNWADLLVLPFRATYVGWDHSPGYGASIGPIFLGLGLISLLAIRGRDDRIRQGLRTAASITLPGLLIWAILGRFTFADTFVLCPFSWYCSFGSGGFCTSGPE